MDGGSWTLYAADAQIGCFGNLITLLGVGLLGPGLPPFGTRLELLDANKISKLEKGPQTKDLGPPLLAYREVFDHCQKKSDSVFKLSAPISRAKSPRKQRILFGLLEQYMLTTHQKVRYYVFEKQKRIFKNNQLLNVRPHGMKISKFFLFVLKNLL